MQDSVSDIKQTVKTTLKIKLLIGSTCYKIYNCLVNITSGKTYICRYRYTSSLSIYQKVCFKIQEFYQRKFMM